MEFGPGAKIIEEVISSKPNIINAVNQLVRIARTCHFEGWLINVESPVRAELIPNLR